MALPPKWYQFLVGLFASLGSFNYGYDLGVIAQVVASDAFVKKFHPNEDQTGLVVSLFTAGAFFGAFFAGYSGDMVGRRATIATAAAVFVLGGCLQAGGRNMSFLQAGRFIAGMGVGTMCMIVPLYQAELAHPTIRGRITALQQFMLGVGALCASWIGYGCYIGFSPQDDNQWRIPLGLQTIPAGILGLLIFIFPESPRWLIDSGRTTQGLQTLANLHAHGDVNDAWVQVEFSAIQASLTHEHDHAAKSWLELFRSRSNFRRIFLCVALQASIQMTGVSAIQYYSPTIFSQIGLSVAQTLRYQAINSVIALIAQFLCMLFIDRLGRRWPLIAANVFNAVTFLIGMLLLKFFPPGSHNPRSAQIGFIATTWLYNFSFSVACGPLSWIIPAEVFNTATRSRGVSLATMASFAMNTMIGQVTPVAMKKVGWRYYILFVICNCTNALFFWALLPETKKVPLEAMDNLFENSPWFIPTFKQKDYLAEFEHEVEAVAEKSGAVTTDVDDARAGV
ncbi:putative MFS sugar transporter [Sphaerosporella brunnea]|uniref:Putative MFS sugar transporter n=1 Tax=Sphaerosporella brunnea TaxID=1250544 RepID=A0A5J5EVW4_9PEZI|nr:putative MFS sugar transporter [Sphaerosporella brunnea]